VVVGDFNGDGRADIVVGSLLRIGRNAGEGRRDLCAGGDLSTGSGVYSVVAGDFDGDGKADLAVTSSSGGITILPGMAMARSGRRSSTVRAVTIR